MTTTTTTATATLTRQTCYDRIAQTIIAHGFPVGKSWNSNLPTIPQERGDVFGLTIQERFHFSRTPEQDGTVTFTYQGRLCQMGGEPTPEELLAFAQEIQRGAELVKVLEALNITYTELA